MKHVYKKRNNIHKQKQEEYLVYLLVINIRLHVQQQVVDNITKAHIKLYYEL